MLQQQQQQQEHEQQHSGLPTSPPCSLRKRLPGMARRPSTNWGPEPVARGTLPGGGVHARHASPLGCGGSSSPAVPTVRQRQHADEAAIAQEEQEQPPAAPPPSSAPPELAVAPPAQRALERGEDDHGAHGGGGGGQRRGGDGPDQRLIQAASSGDVAEVQRLLGSGADVDALLEPGGPSVLSWAARSGHALVLTVLLEAGADWRYTDQGGRSAADWGRLERDAATAPPLGTGRSAGGGGGACKGSCADALAVLGAWSAQAELREEMERHAPSSSAS
eukprot:COSAG01_NODE_3210_length_6414_cov_54.271417_2_plen_277_part_00